MKSILSEHRLYGGFCFWILAVNFISSYLVPFCALYLYNSLISKVQLHLLIYGHKMDS